MGSQKNGGGMMKTAKKSAKFRPLEPWQLKVLADVKRKASPKKN